MREKHTGGGNYPRRYSRGMTELSPRDMSWYNTSSFDAHSFTCGFCGRGVGSDTGYFAKNNSSFRIYVCPFCRRPTYVEPDGSQYPGVAYGSEVEHLPEHIRRLYDEARNCMSVNAYTAAVMASRKLLMNVAVEEGAPKGKKFAEYVKWLANNGYVPTKGQTWVDRIREKGNEANHEIPHVEREDAEDILSFTEMLLKVNDEMPARAAPPDGDDENEDEQPAVHSEGA